MGNDLIGLFALYLREIILVVAFMAYSVSTFSTVRRLEGIKKMLRSSSLIWAWPPRLHREVKVRRPMRSISWKARPKRRRGWWILK